MNGPSCAGESRSEVRAGSMRLFLVRHGEALPKTADPLQPLSPEGKRCAVLAADALLRAGARPVALLHSEKMRATQTAAIISRELPGHPPAQLRRGLAPEDPVDEWEAEAALARTDMVIVGHMPFLPRLASLLVTKDQERAQFAFETGGVLCLERIDYGSWTVRFLFAPSLASTSGVAFLPDGLQKRE